MGTNIRRLFLPTDIFLILSAAGRLHSSTLDGPEATRRARSIGGLTVRLPATEDFRSDRLARSALVDDLGQLRADQAQLRADRVV